MRGLQGAAEWISDGPLYGVSVAEAIARQNELAAKYGVTLQGAVTWALEFEDQPLFAGFRELATGGTVGGKSFLVDKPVLNVFRMMGKLGGDYVAVTSSGALPLEQVLGGSVRGDTDVGVVATRSEHKLEVLLWNYHDDDVAAESAKVKLSIRGFPMGSKFGVGEWLMDAKHSMPMPCGRRWEALMRRLKSSSANCRSQADYWGYSFLLRQFRTRSISRCRLRWRDKRLR